MDKTIKTIIKNRIASLTDWLSSSLVLRKGEIAFGTDGDDVFMKVGDGTKTWSNLPVSYYAKPVIATTTLLANSWSNGLYSFESSYPHDKYNLTVSINGDSCTVAQCKAWDSANIKGSPTTNKIKAMGTVPTIDIPVVITYTKKGQ